MDTYISTRTLIAQRAKLALTRHTEPDDVLAELLGESGVSTDRVKELADVSRRMIAARKNKDAAAVHQELAACAREVKEQNLNHLCAALANRAAQHDGNFTVDADTAALLQKYAHDTAALSDRELDGCIVTLSGALSDFAAAEVIKTVTGSEDVFYGELLPDERTAVYIAAALGLKAEGKMDRALVVLSDDTLALTVALFTEVNDICRELCMPDAAQGAINTLEGLLLSVAAGMFISQGWILLAALPFIASVICYSDAIGDFFPAGMEETALGRKIGEYLAGAKRSLKIFFGKTDAQTPVQEALSETTAYEDAPAPVFG